jgi:hypothetical protein
MEDPQNSGAGFRRPYCFGGRWAGGVRLRGVAGCPRRWGCGGDRRPNPAGSSAQGAGVPPPARDVGEREATIREMRDRSMTRGRTREGRGTGALTGAIYCERAGGWVCPGFSLRL